MGAFGGRCVGRYDPWTTEGGVAAGPARNWRTTHPVPGPILRPGVRRLPAGPVQRLHSSIQVFRMSEQGPLVSVILPTYNREDVLGHSIDSVLSQTYENVELVVVDDGSTDETEAVVRARDDPRLRYYRHERNKGPNAARNTGIGKCNGRYVAFIDSDVEWLPHKVERQVERLETAGEAIGGVYCRAYGEFDGYVKEVPHPGLEGDLYGPLLAGDLIVPTSQLLLKSECFEVVGGWDEDLPCFNEYDLALRLAKEYEFAYMSEPLVINVVHDGMTISRDIGKRIAGTELILEKWGDEMEAHHGETATARFRRRALTTSYRTVTIWNARRGNTWQAVRQARTYLRLSRCSEPLSLLGILLALLNRRLHAAAKRAYYRRSGVTRERVSQGKCQ